MKKTIAKKTKKAKKLIAKPAAIVAFLRDLFAEELHFFAIYLLKNLKSLTAKT